MPGVDLALGRLPGVFAGVQRSLWCFFDSRCLLLSVHSLLYPRVWSVVQLLFQSHNWSTSVCVSLVFLLLTVPVTSASRVSWNSHTCLGFFSAPHVRLHHHVFFFCMLASLRSVWTDRMRSVLSLRSLPPRRAWCLLFRLTGASGCVGFNCMISMSSSCFSVGSGTFSDVLPLPQRHNCLLCLLKSCFFVSGECALVRKIIPLRRSQLPLRALFSHLLPLRSGFVWIVVGSGSAIHISDIPDTQSAVFPSPDLLLLPLINVAASVSAVFAASSCSPTGVV